MNHSLKRNNYDVLTLNRPLRRVAVAVVLTTLVGVGAACGSSEGERAPATAEIPDVVGMNLQDAQDCLQSKGFYYLDDQPAPGEPRFQVNDSNWTVTQQSDVGPGYTFDTPITLTARKDGGYSSKSCP
jgi:hypothetical protein